MKFSVKDLADAGKVGVPTISGASALALPVLGEISYIHFEPILLSGT